MAPPLAVDVDGTLTRPEGEGLDPRVFDVLHDWPAPVVIATGKSVPYPVGLCQFLGIEERAIAETGGVVVDDDTMVTSDTGDRARAVGEEYREAGYDFGWGELDTINRWRETEIAVARSQPLDPLESIASEHELEVVDTGYAYHVKDPAVTKGTGLTTAAGLLGMEPADFVAIGDSDNDVAMFDRAGTGIAVANAAAAPQSAADVVTEGAHADGLVEALDYIEADQ